MPQDFRGGRTGGERCALPNPVELSSVPTQEHGFCGSLSPLVKIKAARRGIFESHVCLLPRNQSAIVPTPQMFELVKQSEPDTNSSSGSYQQCATKTPLTSQRRDLGKSANNGYNETFLVLQPLDSFALQQQRRSSRVGSWCWRVTSVIESQESHANSKMKESRSDQQHERICSKDPWGDVISRIAQWLTADRLSATVLVLGGSRVSARCQRPHSLSNVNVPRNGGEREWEPCIAQRTCVAVFALAKRQRVPCIVDLLSSLSRPQRPSCAGCFFAFPPAHKAGGISREHSTHESISVSPPISAFEACSLIQEARDKMSILEKSFLSAATLFVRLELLQQHPKDSCHDASTTTTPVLHVVFFNGKGRKPQALERPKVPHYKDERSDESPATRKWAARGPLAVLCALLSSLSASDDSEAAQRAHAMQHIAPCGPPFRLYSLARERSNPSHSGDTHNSSVAGTRATFPDSMRYSSVPRRDSQWSPPDDRGLPRCFTKRQQPNLCSPSSMSTSGVSIQSCRMVGYKKGLCKLTGRRQGYASTLLAAGHSRRHRQRTARRVRTNAFSRTRDYSVGTIGRHMRQFIVTDMGESCSEDEDEQENNLHTTIDVPCLPDPVPSSHGCTELQQLRVCRETAVKDVVSAYPECSKIMTAAGQRAQGRSLRLPRMQQKGIECNGKPLPHDFKKKKQRELGHCSWEKSCTARPFSGRETDFIITNGEPPDPSAPEDISRRRCVGSIRSGPPVHANSHRPQATKRACQGRSSAAVDCLISVDNRVVPAHSECRDESDGIEQEHDLTTDATITLEPIDSSVLKVPTRTDAPTSRSSACYVGLGQGDKAKKCRTMERGTMICASSPYKEDRRYNACLTMKGISSAPIIREERIKAMPYTPRLGGFTTPKWMPHPTAIPTTDHVNLPQANSTSSARPSSRVELPYAEKQHANVPGGPCRRVRRVQPFQSQPPLHDKQRTEQIAARALVTPSFELCVEELWQQLRLIVLEQMLHALKCRREDSRSCPRDAYKQLHKKYYRRQPVRYNGRAEHLVESSRLLTSITSAGDKPVSQVQVDIASQDALPFAEKINLQVLTNIASLACSKHLSCTPQTNLPSNGTKFLSVKSKDTSKATAHNFAFLRSYSTHLAKRQQITPLSTTTKLSTSTSP
ncbi:hypothetical protein cyc_06244 [Cyclospora cayetanensis]|uniref:Uncharacterized protein n=1 Tax=Cyclospora cayetanensis TaxID=88456 RepID=A0A1D3CY28_9EIME|nr:hypothetical protein cyc_06244 [Cyclospora cayetanensis]